jgi:hypothetical protein
MTDAVNSLEMGPPADVASLTPQQAKERLAHVTADVTWRDAYLSGSRPHRLEFDGLKARADEADAVDAVMVGANVPVAGGPNINGVSRADTAAAVGGQRQAGVADEYTGRLLRGDTLDPAEYGRYAAAVRIEKFGDPQWTAAVLRKEGLAYSQFMTWMTLVAAQKGRHAPTIMGRW